MLTKMDQLKALAQHQGIIRPRDLISLGIPNSYLARLCQRGVLTRVARGLYQLSDADITENHSLAEVARRTPHGVVCLLSALQFHRLGTQAPFEVWIAIARTAHRPETEHPPLRVVRMSGRTFEAGIENHIIEGTEVRIYSPAKTVADCFKFRNRIGLDVALEALRDFRQEHRNNMDELWEFAHTCRVARVMRPYLEALA